MNMFRLFIKSCSSKYGSLKAKQTSRSAGSFDTTSHEVTQYAGKIM